MPTCSCCWSGEPTIRPRPEAVQLFIYLTKKHIGALIAVLGGIDTLVFTGGIGQHAAPVRSEIVQSLEVLGLDLDPARNAACAEIVSTDGAAIVVRVMATNENLMVARHTWAVMYGVAALSSNTAISAG